MNLPVVSSGLVTFVMKVGSVSADGRIVVEVVAFRKFSATVTLLCAGVVGNFGTAFVVEPPSGTELVCGTVKFTASCLVEGVPRAAADSA